MRRIRIAIFILLLAAALSAASHFAVFRVTQSVQAQLSGIREAAARRITKTPHTKSTHCWNTMKHASICWNSSSGVKPSHPLQSACMACQPMRTAKPYRTCSARSTKQASRSMPWSIYFSASSDAVSRPCVARLFSRSFNSSIKVLISPNWRYTDAKRT